MNNLLLNEVLSKRMNRYRILETDSADRLVTEIHLIKLEDSLSIELYKVN